MNRQRGIADVWLALIGVALIMALAIGGVLAVNHHDSLIDARAYARGVQETTAKFTERDNAQLQAALARVKQLEDQRDALQAQYDERIAQIDAQRQKEVSDAKAQRDRDIAAAVAGTIRLRDPGATACAADGDRSATAPPDAGPGLRDGRAPGQLSSEAARFLLELVNDADDVARQLAAAQAVIAQDRVTCGGTASGISR